jgi:predicted metal-binding membrane protein
MWARAALARAGKGPWPALLCASLAGWALFLTWGCHLAQPFLCTAGGSHRLAWNPQALQFALEWTPLSGSAQSWFFMLLAMTPPLLAQPMRRLWHGSLARRRVAAVAAFVLGYGALWMAAGAVLIAAATVAGVELGPVAAPAILGVALLWSVSPAKKTFLGLCHRAPTLRAFGVSAYRDCLEYGAMSGAWCVGVCWPLMLLSLVAAGAHAEVMAGVFLLTILERHTSLWALLRATVSDLPSGFEASSQITR